MRPIATEPTTKTQGQQAGVCAATREMSGASPPGENSPPGCGAKAECPPGGRIQRTTRGRSGAIDMASNGGGAANSHFIVFTSSFTARNPPPACADTRFELAHAGRCARSRAYPHGFGGDCESGDDGAELARQARGASGPAALALTQKRRLQLVHGATWSTRGGLRRMRRTTSRCVRPNFAPPAPERRVVAVERRPSVRLAIVTRHRRALDVRPRALVRARAAVCVAAAARVVRRDCHRRQRPPATGGGVRRRARVLPINRELLAAYRTCRRSAATARRCESSTTTSIWR